MRYQSAPRNIYRHIILSEMKEATAALPLVRGPDGAQAMPLRAARRHSRPCRACGRWARLKPQPPARSIRQVSSLYVRLPGAAHGGGTRGQARLQLVPGSVALPKTKGCPAAPTVSVPRCLLLPATQPSPLLSSSPPQEVTSQPVMGFDPLPPLDSIVSYTRPERYLLHPSFLRWHNRRVPGAPSAPGLGCTWVLGADVLLHLGRKSGLACGARRQAERTGRTGPAGFSLVVTAGDGGCSQPLRQRPLKNFGCFLTEVVWGKQRFKRSRPWCAQPVGVKPVRVLRADPARSKPGSAFSDCFAQRLASCWLPGVRNPQESPHTLLRGWLRRGRGFARAPWFSPASLPCLSRSERPATTPPP